MTRSVGRRHAMLAPLLGAWLLISCSDEEPAPRTNFPALDYSYLPVLRLSVASIAIDNRATIIANDFSPQSPMLPTDALALMAMERLQASGDTGRAEFVIDQASIVRTDTGLFGTFVVHINILSADNQRVAYAMAKVTRVYTGDIGDLRGTLYDMTKQMMDDMNVELEYQIRRTLADWLQIAAPTSSVTPVQSQSLTSPPVVPDATPAPAPTPVPPQPPGQ